MRKEFWKFGENVVLNQTFLRDDLGGKWRHLDRFYEILTIGLCFFWAVLIIPLKTKLECGFGFA